MKSNKMKYVKKMVTICLAAVMMLLATACAGKPEDENTSGSTGSADSFPKFQTKDFDGNDVDDSLFSNNTVTLVNFWFNECSPCIEELPALEEMDEYLKEKGGSVLGINAGGTDETNIEAAKEILKSQNVDYQNVTFESDSEAGELVGTIQAFPTTMLIDRNGNIVGEPILGNINGGDTMEEVKARIDEIVEKDAQK